MCVCMYVCHRMKKGGRKLKSGIGIGVEIWGLIASLCLRICHSLHAGWVSGEGLLVFRFYLVGGYYLYVCV
ncbi:uncharacterized protein BO87DRAFT_230713 [Aspergillus neoniger CBS 115656]|uniref:Uncharacterized protein n=1 Tax=Aspergillus neoniger (strain CBS 115656) TaxID=1448310 RepID=A0A318ZLG9_ASPNB|nr:hypothetical protein BO87DRAFT_230713 [Aspergillus neoniger CBS 115656]PYH36762.1 hypothetical protein BO87DRAFT_230713 [Aspergillus neoniger CBS 115656]